jgi:hypothetical protein
VAILVDEALWEWRGRRWAHLVSDASYDELHAFAARLGVDRRSFQRDHYDVPSTLRARAIELGAEAVGSRELLRRLKGAGLRQSSASHRSGSPSSSGGSVPTQQECGPSRGG